jgi:hypothetical protein
VVLSTPFYAMNLAAFGNPVWPLRVPDGATGYADRIALRFGQAVSGSHTSSELAQSVWRLFTEPLLLPIPLLVVAAFLLLVLARAPASLRAVGGFGLIFLLVWGVAQPALYPRFSLLLVPPGVLAAGWVIGLLTRPGGAAERLAATGFVALALAGLLAGSFYTADAARYLASGDAARFHRATWYHGVYDWINRSTPPESRLLVVVLSGHSYHLERGYRKADPSLSGALDWSGLRDTAHLERVMAEGGFDFLLYDDADWSQEVGGSRMTALVRGAVAEGRLVPVRTFHVERVTSRIGGVVEPSTVHLLRRRNATAARGTTSGPGCRHPINHPRTAT